MDKKFSVRRLVENEAVFRQYNRHIEDGLVKLSKLAREEGEPAPDHSMHIHFYCECSDENCRKRINMSFKQYDDTHKNNRQFIVLPGHETPACESVVKLNKDYTIVQKFIAPPNGPLTLHKTPIMNV